MPVTGLTRRAWRHLQECRSCSGQLLDVSLYALRQSRRAGVLPVWFRLYLAAELRGLAAEYDPPQDQPAGPADVTGEITEARRQ